MPSRTWTIRKASASDANALTECMHTAYLIYTKRLGGQTLPPLTVDYEEEIRSFPSGSQYQMEPWSEASF